jgi:uncharacterized membrane protein YkvA (DUF1232 family)
VGGFGIMEGYLDDMAIGVVALSLLLLSVVFKMHNPKRLKNLYLDDTTINESALDELEQKGEIIEWYRNDTEKLAIVKYDDATISEEKILELTKS